MARYKALVEKAQDFKFQTLTRSREREQDPKGGAAQALEIKVSSMAYERYRRFVEQHQGLIAVVESAITTVTWLLPDRFAENEFTLEGIHTVANLISVFHDSILNEVNHRAPKGAQELTLALNALEQVEVLVELYAVHSGGKNRSQKINRYSALLVIESLKALVRLAIYRKSDRLMLLHGGAEGMFAVSNEGNEDHAREKMHMNGHMKSDRDAGGDSTTRKARDCFISESLVTQSTKANKVLKAFQAFRESRAPPLREDPLNRMEESMELAIRRAHKRLFAGELLHIVRPVIYVGMLRLWGIKSWKPWLSSLILELLSAEATRSAWATSNDAAVGAAQELAKSTGSSIASLYARQGIRLGSRDMDEITRRKMLLMLYLIRDPLFSRRTRPVLQACVRATSRVPLLSTLVNFPVSLLEGIQRYYSYIQ